MQIYIKMRKKRLKQQKIMIMRKKQKLNYNPNQGGVDKQQ